jgi:diguanylate cyclase (GGDEF)-like protein
VHFTPALNIILGSAVLIVLMFADYARKYNTDACQRRLFLALLVFSFLAMASDFVYYLVAGIPGKTFRAVLYAALLNYYFFQNLAFYYSFLLFDFLFAKDQKRTAGFRAAVWIVAALHCIILLLNHRWRFYFSIAGGNRLHYGSYYFIRIIASYLPAAFISLDVLWFLRKVKMPPLLLTLCFVAMTGLSSAIDFLFETNSLIWPCFACSLLYAYFFIIQTDSKIDALTGLGNRSSFNEFISKISSAGNHPRRNQERSKRRFLKRKSASASYSFAMIDMDHFKMINDTLGHLEGDNALRDMAGIIKACIRSSDFAARYGGDEFILAVSTEYDIVSLLGRIQAAINEFNEKGGRPYELQISYGYDSYSANSEIPITDFLKHVDSLMYKHKNERRRASDRENNRGNENNQERKDDAVILH